MARTGDAQEAARRAGYANPRQRAHEALKLPQVNNAIVAHSEARLHNDLVPLALDTLRELMGKDKPDKIRLDASKVTLTNAKGLVANAMKDEADWTLDDIRAKIRAVSAALDEANVIEHEAAAAPLEPEPEPIEQPAGELFA